jgi:hypothetical protein
VSDAGAPGRSFGYWLTIFANLAVVGGIGFLGIEVQQNTAMIEAQIMQSRTETAVSEQQALYNSEFIPPLLAKLDRGEELSDEEMWRFRPYLRGFSRNMDNQLWQYRHGFLEDNIPRSVRNAVRQVIGASALSISVWDAQKVGFTDEYVAFVEQAIADLRSQEQ